MQALEERENTPQLVTPASHPNAVTSSAVNGNVQLAAHRAIGKHSNMDSLLENEVGNGATICNVAKLNETLFPDKAFPIPPKAALVEMNKMSSWYKDGHWQQRPPNWGKEGSEVDIADYIQRICEAYAKLLETKKVRKTKIKAKTRVWTAAYRNKTLPGGFVPRKPDIVSVDPTVEEPTWGDIGSDVQIKISPEELDAITKQLRDGGLNVLSARDDRHFHIGVGIAKTGIFTLLSDRSGCLRSEVIDLEADPVKFLRIILGLTFSSEEHLGRNPDIKMMPDGARRLKIGRAWYQILERVDKEAGIRGPGSVRWRCQRMQGDKEMEIVSVKSAWVDRSRQFTEDVYLKHAQDNGVKDIATPVKLVYVKHRGPGLAGARKNDQVSTATLRKKVLTEKQLEENPFETRDLTLLVQKESDVPLSSFRTLPELLYGLLDSVEAHRNLCELEDVGILHTDINDRSVRLNQDSESAPGIRRGLLQDLNNARFVHRSSEGSTPVPRTAATGLRSCVPTFTSCEILMGLRRVEQEDYHDLESFFNLLLHQCIFYEGSDSKLRKIDVLKEVPLVAGWTDPNMYQAGSNKWGVLSLKRPSADSFGNFINDAFAPYFNPLKPCICELRRLVMDQNSKATHAEFIEILRRHADIIRQGNDNHEAPEGEEDAPGDTSDPGRSAQDNARVATGTDEGVAEPSVPPHAITCGTNAASSGSADETTEQVVDQPGSESAGHPLPAGDIVTDARQAPRVMCTCQGISSKRFIKCKDPQCPVVYYHRDCVNRGSRPRGSAKNWRCEKCRNRKKPAQPVDDFASNPTNDPANDSVNVPVNDPANDPVNDPANDSVNNPANNPADGLVNNFTSDPNDVSDNQVGHQEPK
ncbi:hypothetical protein K525DRAFT_283487 [Schizophyllum commune Loenen D]|nr:hypothetical protein K525DRAFT_283487 [Schizophyllum commune Loenen D]